MKFPGIPLLFIFVVIFVIVAGCNSVPPSKETSPVPTDQPITLTPEPTVSQLATPQLSDSSDTGTLKPLPSSKEIFVDSSAITNLILTQNDFPSLVVSSNEQSESGGNNKAFHYGYQNGYLLEVVLEKDSSKVSQLVAIMDTKANASKTFDQLDAQYAPVLQIQNPNISVTANSVAVGDRGKIYVVKGTLPQNKWQYILFFAHGNVFEMITMDVPGQSSYDEKVIMDLAGIADRKIIQKSVSIPSPITTIPTTSIPITDDDVYIENVENYFIQLNETMYGIISSEDSPELQSFKGAAELKILSKTYYNRIEPLKVFSKLELSKNSFLQYLTEMSIIADLQTNETSLFTMNEEQRKHSCNAEMFILNTFDSELCSVIVEKKQFLLPYCITRDVHSC